MENNKLGIINAMSVQTLKYLTSLGIALDQLLSINSDELKLCFQLTKNEPRIKSLVNMGLDIKQLLDMETDQQKLFIKNPPRIKSLIDTGLDIKQLLDMETDQQKLFIENALIDHTKISIVDLKYYLDYDRYDILIDHDLLNIHYDICYNLNKIHVDNSDESDVVIAGVLSVLGDLAA